jgi:DNA-binding NarL/FixJ family response regulator
VIAEKDVIGACLAEVLREHGFDVEVMESFGELHDGPHETFDLVIVTNTSVPPRQIKNIIPEIKVRLPDARLIVLSGYCPDDFVAELLHKGMDGFLPLPYDQDSLLKRVDGLLSLPAA